MKIKCWKKSLFILHFTGNHMIFEKLVHDLLIIINSNIISILIIIRIRLLRDRGFQPHQPQVVFSNWQTKARGISRIHDKQIGYILPRICSVINHPPMTSKFIRTIKVAHKVQLSVSLIFLLHFYTFHELLL